MDRLNEEPVQNIILYSSVWLCWLPMWLPRRFRESGRLIAIVPQLQSSLLIDLCTSGQEHISAWEAQPDTWSPHEELGRMFAKASLRNSLSMVCFVEMEDVFCLTRGFVATWAFCARPGGDELGRILPGHVLVMAQKPSCRFRNARWS